MNKTPCIPYCTVKGFRKCLDILRGEPLPARLERHALLSRGLSPHAIYPVLGAFRYLGLISDDGQVSPQLEAFLRDDADVRQAVVTAAYADVLRTIQFPVHDREEVDRILMEQHGCAPGVAAFCSTFFLWLAAEAGMPVALVGRARRGRPPAHLAQLSPFARALHAQRATAAAGSAPMSLDDIFEATEQHAPVPEAAPRRRGGDAART